MQKRSSVETYVHKLVQGSNLPYFQDWRILATYFQDADICCRTHIAGIHFPCTLQHLQERGHWEHWAGHNVFLLRQEKSNHFTQQL